MWTMATTMQAPITAAMNETSRPAVLTPSRVRRRNPPTKAPTMPRMTSTTTP